MGKLNIKALDEKYIIGTYKRQDVVLVRGESATGYDENGRSYIDFGSGIGVNSLGYSDLDWSRAVSEQAARLQHTSNLYYSEPCARLAASLCETTGYKKALFCNSGAEANECAIKLARKYSFDKTKSKSKILALQNSFHGRTITTLSATGQEVFHNYFFPFTEGFTHIAAGDFEGACKLLSTGEYCGVMLELVQGEGGVIPLAQDFVNKLFSYCEKNDILTIADEVQTGVGRTGRFLASQHYGVKPDITTLAKGLGGGLPIGACLVDEKAENVFSFSDHGTTFGGNPVSCAGALVVMEKLSNPAALDRIAKIGEQIREALLECDDVVGIDGLGMMLGVRLKNKTAPEVLAACLKEGLIVLTAKDKIRLLPPLTITPEELLKGIDILRTVLKAFL